jgi:hypothetical protein
MELAVKKARHEPANPPSELIREPATNPPNPPGTRPAQALQDLQQIGQKGTLGT